MKALSIILIILSIGLFVAPSHAVDWKNLNQATVAWDAVTTLSDGSAIPEGSSIQYRVYMANAVTDPNKTNPAVLGTIPNIEYLITINAEGKYIIGVSAVRFADGAEVEESDINWSDVNGDSTPNPFGFVHYLKPAIPKNLR